MKQAILDYFKDNFEPFYRKYLPEIEKIGGDEWRVLCPFHDDHNPSFNFSAKTGQYFCHGCRKKGDIFHFYGETNGLSATRDFEIILHRICSDFGISAPQQPRGKETAHYNYQDADGNFLYQVVRIEPGKNGKKKDFRQRRHGTNGDWIYNLKGIERVLYHLPEVIQANEILIVIL